MPDINTDAPILNAAVDTDAPVLSASVSTDEPAVAANLAQLRYLVFEGKKGEDGFSPTVTVTDIEGGHRVTITDEDGDHTFDVMDGEDGEDGGFQTAVFGSTTASEIRAWINDGTPVRCVYDGREYWCSSVTESGASSYRAVFACCDSALSGLTRTYKLHILDAGDTVPPTWTHYVVDLGPELPAVTASDNGKVLGVVSGAWTVKADETNVMTVTYNSNTNPGTIKDAVDHGYVVRCVYNNMEYFCSEASTSSAYFHALGANTIYQIALHWTNGAASWSNSSKAYPSASYTTPIVDGTAAVGSETAFARGDHVHPTDTSRLATNGNAYRTASIPFAQVDSTSTSTAFTASVPGITELRSGVCVMLMNGVVTSESGFTVNINNLGAKPVYSTLAAASRATTLFNINYTLFLVYNEERVDGGCWDAYYGYDSNTNTIGYQLRTNSTTMPVTDKFYRYRLLFTAADGKHYVPANTSSSTNATSSRTVNQRPIDPFGAIFYYGNTTAINANANPSTSYMWTQYNFTLGYSFNRTGAALVLTNHAPVYIKCAPQSDGSAIIDADNPYVQTLPSTADGKIYIFLGIASGETTVELFATHPVYCYRNNSIQLWTGGDTGSGGGGSGGGDDPNVPTYVKAEARSVAARVASVLQNDSIVFCVGSDAHESTTANVSDGNSHAGMGMKALRAILDFDFMAYLGDYTAGSQQTTINEGLGHIDSVNEDIASAFYGMPQFRTVGNHDPLGYSYNQNGAALTQTELYQLIGSYNADSGAEMGSTTAGYCYRDFPDKSFRVICLNTADKTITSQGSAEAVSDTQKKWFADTLISTPSGYGIIVLSHHPLDWGDIMSVSHILRAYKEQQASINIGGTAYSFTNKNKSAWILAFHGHVHCYRVDNLHWNNGGVGTPYDVKRIAVPNMCFVRNNEYGQNAGAEYYGIEFGESMTYTKTANSGEDTAFCVMVVNPTEQKVHAIHYGAGYDREVYFGASPVAVTGVTLNAASGTLNIGGSTTLTATVAPANATNKTVIWSTSNPNVATVQNGTVTAIGTGTATITVTTQDGGYTATYTLTVQSISGNLRDYFGYTIGKRLSTGDGTYRDLSGGLVVEYIDLSEFVTPGLTITIRTKGVLFQSWQSGPNYNNNAYAFYNGSHGFTLGSYLTDGSDTHGNITVTRTFAGDADNTMTLTISGIGMNVATSNYHYIRICGLGDASNLDIRVNETFD